MMGGVLSSIAGLIFKDALRTKGEQLLSSAGNYATDKIESIITGRRSIEEWAEIAANAVDKVKDKIASEENLKYVGGKLGFHILEANPKYVIISFQLYFIDENNEWKKVEGHSDVFSSNFTEDALNDMNSSGKIEFDVE